MRRSPLSTTTRIPLAFAAVVALGLSACTESSSGAPTSTTVVTTTTLAPTTTVGRTTTTAATTTTSEPLPIPQAIPPDGTEVYLELGTIEIPRIDLKVPMLEGVTDTTLDAGPGHWPGTAMPGRVGNVVVGGHRTSSTRPFRHVDQLEPGDEVVFTTEDGRFVYLVDRTEIVKPTDVWIINQTPERTATLFACHPVGSTDERIVVFLTLAE